MSGARQTVGERVASLQGRFEAFEGYEHDRWHKLNNDLMPIIALPEKLAREMGRLEGIQSGRLSAISKEFEATLKEAITQALEPVSKELINLRTDVDELKLGAGKNSVVRQLGLWVVQTLISIAAALAAVLSVKHG